MADLFVLLVLKILFDMMGQYKNLYLLATLMLWFEAIVLSQYSFHQFIFELIFVGNTFTFLKLSSEFYNFYSILLFCPFVHIADIAAQDNINAADAKFLW
jgi:hypothetical protein